MDAPTLPGEELVTRGIADLQHGRRTIEALLVSIGTHRLRALGLPVADPIPDPERSLYDLLSEESGDGAHSRYNALVRRLVSYERAAECGGR
jgi:hypothetical protein